MVQPISRAGLTTHRDEFQHMLRLARAPRLRAISEFAEAEITLPNTGPKANRKFRCDYQPFSRLWFDAIESSWFDVLVATGPSQSGKTLDCLVIPALYHLFEMRENIIIFSPHMEICEDKWTLDMLPVIERSRFAELIPRSGRGSQGGFSELIRFRNGCYLKFMTGGGGDKNKAAITAKVALGTEIDGMDSIKKTSRETDPIGQIAARLASFGSRSRMYLECTVSIPEGRIWKEYTGGTASRIALQCPHCQHWVSPEREHFLGWEAATTEIEAEALGQFFCPDCGTGWSEEQRTAANRNCRLLHRGQEITPDGTVVGPHPQTRTLGFRWSAVNNQFAEAKMLSRKLFKAARSSDREAVEKELHQFIWCVPYDGESTSFEINEKLIASRLSGLPRGVVPDDYESLVVQIDLHNRWHYWTVMAQSPGAVRTIVDYGLHATPNVGINGPEIAIRLGLEYLADDLDQIGRWKTSAGKAVPIDLHFIDAGYQQDIGLEFVTSAGPGWKLSKGERDRYKQPKEKTREMIPGDHWLLSLQSEADASGRKKWWLVLNDASYWMRQVHAGFVANPFLEDGRRRPGSITLFGDDPEVHRTPVDKAVSRSAFTTQIMGWKWQETTTPKKGSTMGWVAQWREDHWFDTTYGCLAAGSFMEAVRASEQDKKAKEEAQRQADRNESSGKFVRSIKLRKK